MKTFLIVIGTVAVIGLVGIGIWSLLPPNTPQQGANNIGSSFPIASSTAVGQSQPIPNQQAIAGTQPEVAQALREQIQNANLITLKGTTVASTYALQTWGDENKGGEALLQYDSSRGWVLISMGGGAWSVSSLVTVGVPQSIAEQLIAGR